LLEFFSYWKPRKLFYNILFEKIGIIWVFDLFQSVAPTDSLGKGRCTRRAKSTFPFKAATSALLAR